MKKITIFVLLLMLSALPLSAQKRKPKYKSVVAKPVSSKVVFAVLNDGKTIEPIVKLDKEKLVPAVSGSDEQSTLRNFNKTYYKPKTVYNLIFAGKVNGTVSVVKNDPNAECSANMAEVTTKSSRANLKGKVMALATDLKPAKPTSGVRRLPTFPERAEVNKLVEAEFVKHNISGKKIDYHNLTALDVDDDKNIEFVGSYWVNISPTEKALLFFIAHRDSDKNLGFGFSDFRTIKQDEVMSGEIKDLDDGVYHELLLDGLDIDDDGVAEIFTYIQSFEGAGFNVYKRDGANWKIISETSNYHCGY